MPRFHKKAIHACLASLCLLYVAGCGKDTENSEKEDEKPYVEPDGDPSAEGEGGSEVGTGKDKGSPGTGDNSKTGSKRKPGHKEEQGKNRREQTLPFNLQDINKAVAKALEKFPKANGRSIKRDLEDIISFKSFGRNDTPDVNIYVKFVYTNRFEENNPEKAVVYFWCHYHGETMFCHGRSLGTVPFDKINEPGCEEAPNQCDDFIIEDRG